MTQSTLHSLFPVPALTLRGLLDADEVKNLVGALNDLEWAVNSQDERLQHAQLSLKQNGIGAELERRLLAPVRALGECLMPGAKGWQVVDVWANRMGAGASQHVHRHGNSCLSGVLYLSDVCDGSTTRIHHPGGAYAPFLDCDRAQDGSNPFQAQTWQERGLSAGDALLFPSFLPHAASNAGSETRITVAFNAIPQELWCGSYGLQLAGGRERA